MNILGLILARGGSKRVPGKNIRVLGGKPLIAWTIEAAHQSGVLSDIVVSTDDEAIADVAETNDIWFHVDAAYGGFFILCLPG